ncbi:hypothetical protein LCGC14_1768580, partial [marine sediment metagenome]
EKIGNIDPGQCLEGFLQGGLGGVEHVGGEVEIELPRDIPPAYSEVGVFGFFLRANNSHFLFVRQEILVQLVSLFPDIRHTPR